MRRNKIDLHTHSVLSKHAFSSFTENIEYAASIGLKVYGISEHQPDKVGVGAHPYSFGNCAQVAPKQIKDTKILVGIELNITDEDFDIEKVRINELSYTIASMHAYAFKKGTVHTFDSITNNYIRACNTPYVTIIGHMDFPMFACDYEKVIKAAKQNNKIIELNEASLNPYGSRKGSKEKDYEILKYCAQYKVPVILSSDAHIKYDIGKTDLGEQLLQEIKFPEELIVNFNEDLFNSFFKYR